MATLRGIWQKLLFDLVPWECRVCGLVAADPDSRRFGICPDCRAGLQAMAEPRCRVCGLSLSAEMDDCLSCRAFGSALPGVGAMRSAFLYGGGGPDVLHAYKAGGALAVAGLFAEALEPHLAALWREGAAIVGVPSLPRNIRRRGFDQVAAVVARLPARYRAAWLPGLVSRRGGVSQKTLGRSERAVNLQGQLRLGPRPVAGRPVILVDDVCTTGATLSQCARLLLEAGCARVDALTVFRD